MRLRNLLFGFGLCWCLPAWAGPTLTTVDNPPEQVRVFRVFDGDRLLVRTRTHSQRVQLAGVDAPELGQPGGEGSKKILEKMVARKRVVIKVVGENTVGDPLVEMQWDKFNINQEMVRAGAAWASPAGGPALRAAEAEARSKGYGIWAKDQPPAIPPWEWRTDHERED
jgi:micrococcal nuclease